MKFNENTEYKKLNDFSKNELIRKSLRSLNSEKKDYKSQNKIKKILKYNAP